MSAISRSRCSGERLVRSPALRTDFPGSMAWSLRMRQSPSIVPKGTDQDVYLVEDDLGRLGRIWREVDSENTGFETVVSDLLDGQYKNPVRVISFNIAEGWSRDVSADIACGLRKRCERELRELPAAVEDFVEAYETERS
jgi:hypothetical protein